MNITAAYPARARKQKLLSNIYHDFEQHLKARNHKNRLDLRTVDLLSLASFFCAETVCAPPHCVYWRLTDELSCFQLLAA
jgi:hypothetical protein